MRRYIYTLDLTTKFQVGGINGFAMTAAAQRSSGDVAILNVSGSHGGVKDLVSDRFYVVTEGIRQFNIDGDGYPVGPDDVIVAPPNTVLISRGK